MLGRREFVGAAGTALAGAAWSRPTLGQEAGKAPRATRIKVGQIGVGHAHASKLSVFRKSPDYEVVGIVEPNPELRRRAESQEPFRELPWMTQEQLLNIPGLQLVLVETEVQQLLDAALACVNAGKHIHLDKPAGESLPQFIRIIQIAHQKSLLVQMGYMYRYNPAIVMLHDFLAKEWLGEVFEVHAVMSKVVPPADRKRLARFHGGVMFELGCHLIDLVVAILGKPESVAAFNRHTSSIDDGLVDNMLAVLSYPKATATVKSSALEVEGGARRHLVVCGTEGTFHIQPLDDPAARIALSRPRGQYKQGIQDVSFPKYVRYVDDAGDIARMIRGENPIGATYDHDVAVQEVLLQACEMPTRA